MGVAHRNVWGVLYKQQLHPFKPQRVHAMGTGDYPLRVDFVRWFMQRSIVEPDFPTIVMFTDEALFDREGVYNTRNSHVWDDGNPHSTFVHGHQQRFGVNVW